MRLKFKGSSLAEAIISIGIIGILSGFILQMFLVSSNVNQKAKELDMGSVIVVNAIEEFKSADSIKEYIDSVDGLQITKNDDLSKITIVNNYDDDWQESSLKNKYQLRTIIFKDTETGGGILYNIEVSIMNVSRNDENILNYSSGKYFVKEI